MQRSKVTSSNIHSIGYDGDSQTLEIEFTKSGIYQYYNVPELIYRQLMGSISKGKYFSQNITDKFRSRKV